MLHTPKQQLTWLGHAPLQLLEGVPRQQVDLVFEAAMPVQGEVPEAGLSFAVSAQLVAGLAEAAVEAQIMANRVFPAVWSRLEEGKVLPVKEKNQHLKAKMTLPSTFGSHDNS